MSTQPVIAHLADGTELHFPAGTSPDVVQKAVKTQIAGGTHSTAQPEQQLEQQPTDIMHEAAARIAPAGSRINPRTGLPMREINPEGKATEDPGIKILPYVAGMLVAGPAGSAAGGGILGAAAGGAAGAGTTTLADRLRRLVGGEKMSTGQIAGDVATSSATGGMLGGTLGLFEKVAGGLLASKLARGMVNESVGATARDVTYGNPAVGIMKANVTSPFTGDLEAYKVALRSGAPQEQALIAAGGRVAQVSQRINQLSPQLDQALAKVTTPIQVSEAIDKPLLKAMNEIINNRAMTSAEKDTAVAQIGALQQSLKEGLGPTITPLEANQIKQAISARQNWAGNIAVTDEVKPAYRAVFASLKNAVNKAVPDAAGINEDLTNLLAAQTDLQKLMQAEEAGMGKGALGSAVTGIARRLEAVMGRFTPGMAGINQAVTQATPAAAGQAGASIADQLRAKGRELPTAAPNTPGLPFHPGTGLTRTQQ